MAAERSRSQVQKHSNPVPWVIANAIHIFLPMLTGLRLVHPADSIFLNLSLPHAFVPAASQTASADFTS